MSKILYFIFIKKMFFFNKKDGLLCRSFPFAHLSQQTHLNRTKKICVMLAGKVSYISDEFLHEGLMCFIWKKKSTGLIESFLVLTTFNF